MRQSINHTITLQFSPNPVWLAPGPGWAALAGTLAVGSLTFEAEPLLRLGLLWLLADPILGTIWHLLMVQRVWQRLSQPQLPAETRLQPVPPYLIKNSAAYHMLLFLTNLRTQPDGLGYTLVISLILAVGLGLTLGWAGLGYALLSLAIIGGASQNGVAASAGQRSFWQATVTFLLPYLAGMTLIGSITPSALWLGLAYWVAYLGLLRLLFGDASGRWLVSWGQVTAILLLLGLHQPLIAAVTAPALLFSLLLYHHARRQTSEPTVWYGLRLKPFLLFSFLIASVSLGVV